MNSFLRSTYRNCKTRYFIPSANPDGYAYSWDHDRLWRKTRSDHGSILGCKGVDPNRNWGFHYGESGVSHNKCAETYCGPEAFSEPEMRNIRDFVTTLDPVPVLGMAILSGSQIIDSIQYYPRSHFPLLFPAVVVAVRICL